MHEMGGGAQKLKRPFHVNCRLALKPLVLESWNVVMFSLTVEVTASALGSYAVCAYKSPPEQITVRPAAVLEKGCSWACCTC